MKNFSDGCGEEHEHRPAYQHVPSGGYRTAGLTVSARGSRRGQLARAGYHCWIGQSIEDAKIVTKEKKSTSW
jgi:hypothetical protein